MKYNLQEVKMDFTMEMDRLKDANKTLEEELKVAQRNNQNLQITGKMNYQQVPYQTIFEYKKKNFGEQNFLPDEIFGSNAKFRLLSPNQNLYRFHITSHTR